MPISTTSRSDSAPSSQQLAEGVAAHELGDEVDGLVVAAGLVERDDRRVRQARRGQRLALGPRGRGASPSTGIRLTATGRSSRSSRASQTAPKPPEPSSSSSA